MRVAAGAIARKYLRERLNLEIRGYLSAIGPLTLAPANLAVVDSNPFFCADPDALPELEKLMDQLRAEGNSIGARIT
jgi:chorismate synthase